MPSPRYSFEEPILRELEDFLYDKIVPIISVIVPGKIANPRDEAAHVIYGCIGRFINRYKSGNIKYAVIYAANFVGYCDAFSGQAPIADEAKDLAVRLKDFAEQKARTLANER